MRKLGATYWLTFMVTLLLLAFFRVSVGECEVKVSYLFHLSNFTGAVPYMWPKVRVDNAHREVYVVSGDGVRVFNEAGMETYDFGHKTELTPNHDIAADEEGNLYLLFASYNIFSRQATYSINRCDYKLEPMEKIELQEFPAELAGFIPYQIFFRNGFFYLGDPGTMTVAVTDKQGRYKKHYNLGVLTGLNKLEEDAAISDFFVDKDSAIFFTAPVIARVYRVSADGSVAAFGRRGSAPGRLGVPAAVVCDSEGNFFVSDKLKSAVIVFDKDFNFVTEFGFRGPMPQNLVVPTSLTIDDHNRLYVSQLAKRGVSVFQITNN